MKQDLSLSIRINLGHGGRFGPGKAALLEAIDDTGSISKAASALGMSYPRALKLIDEMNGDFADPLVKSTHGGTDRGGSEVTETGQTVLALYHSVNETSLASSVSALKKLMALESDN
ncbi:LysR family transcriptional regulator [Henriciella sp. AS95]|uniref:winged helix-turn-helix domain-containing protein n=1 Tax=Henriciella sp. AS95 TaxID=3135782 RepID=UPI00317F9188